MNTLTALSVTQANEETYNKLLVSLEAGLGMLQIFIAVCDNDRQREEIIANYERELAPTAQTYRVYLDPQEPSLRLAISEQVTVRENAIATVTGAEGLSERGQAVEKFLGYLQWTREGLREFKMPIVLWIPARIFAQLAKNAPDFYSWRNGIFQFHPEPSFVTNEPSENRGIDSTANDSSSSLFSVEQLESSLAQGIEQWGENSRNLEPLYSQLGSLYASRVQSRKSEDREREYALAQDYLNKAIALQKQFKQEESLASSLHNLASLYDYHREYEQAEALDRQALEINRAGENQAEIAKVLNNLADLHSDKNEMAIAEQEYQEALEIVVVPVCYIEDNTFLFFGTRQVKKGFFYQTYIKGIPTIESGVIFIEITNENKINISELKRLTKTLVETYIASHPITGVVNSAIKIIDAKYKKIS